jgi:AAA15 family ATPase/GTPase
LIIRFRFENYRSFREAQELSLVANSSREKADSLIATNAAPHGLVRSAAIYGANASGKSNVLQALQFFVSAIRSSQRQWAPTQKISVEPFALTKNQNEVSSFQLDFIVGGVPYQYAFAVTAEQVVREWLYSYPNGRKQTWFDRPPSAEGPITFGAHFTGENKAIENLTRKNSLFLSAAAQNNHLMLSPLFTWLTTKINILFDSGSRTSSHNTKEMRDAALRERVTAFLKHADLGIVGIAVETKPYDEKLIELMNILFAKISEYTPSLNAPAETTDKSPAAPTEIDVLSLQHKLEDGSTVSFTPSSESSGTMAFLSLLPRVLEAIESGGVLCVDELDSSLHPLLALELVKLFNDHRFNRSGAQFIFNTHDVNLLDSDVLRRDQIWFTEKGTTGESHLYALTDFKPKTNENLKRGYLQGRFGAIPFLGTFPWTDGVSE